MHDVVFLSGVRTPIGAFSGSLAALTAPQLGSIAIRGALGRAGVPADRVDEVILGCVLTGGMGQAPARQASLGAGIPESVPCMTINKVCGSGMKAAMLAAQSIRLGESRIAIAGGMESMSNAPYVLDKARAGYRMGNGTLIDSMIHDGLWDPYNNVHMGNCGDLCAREKGYGRDELDDYAAESFRRAQEAVAAGRLAEEIVPVEIPQRKGDPIVVGSDEGPGKGGDREKLRALRAAFDKEGVTTAGNASSINDGAAAMVMASAEAAAEGGWKPIGRLVASATHAQNPQWFTTAPAAAMRAAVERAGIGIGDVDLFEVNEAFAVVAMANADELGIDRAKLNVNGGAVALGHPIGMTGARLVLTALHELRRRGGRFAVCSPCIGGGEATAVVVEAL